MTAASSSIRRKQPGFPRAATDPRGSSSDATNRRSPPSTRPQSRHSAAETRHASPVSRPGSIRWQRSKLQRASTSARSGLSAIQAPKHRRCPRDCPVTWLRACVAGAYNGCWRDGRGRHPAPLSARCVYEVSKRRSRHYSGDCFWAYCSCRDLAILPSRPTRASQADHLQYQNGDDLTYGRLRKLSQYAR